MSEFSNEWLDLREPADRAARDGGLLREAIAAAGGEAATVVDLGCGTGATMRAYRAAGAGGLSWRLVDRDARLLAVACAPNRAAPAHFGARTAHLSTRNTGSAHTLEIDLTDLDALPLDGAGLVTASALFDLVPAAWVAGLAERLAGRSLPLHAMLSFDGGVTWDPPHPLDGEMLSAFNDHQRRDKGLGGAALGAAATQALAGALEGHGYGVRTAPSPWRLDGGMAMLQRAKAEGMAQAAIETGMEAASVADWLAARRRLAATGRCTVGHTDLLALPPGQNTQSMRMSVPRS